MLLNPHETADLVTFTEEILNEKFFCLVMKTSNPIDPERLYCRKDKLCPALFVTTATHQKCRDYCSCQGSINTQIWLVLD